jgi:two-component system chemotaxis response regulator CheY
VHQPEPETGVRKEAMQKIIITDDAMFMRVTLKNILTSNGYFDIAEAVNGQEAVDLCSELQPALVLLDITMPVLDGISAARLINQRCPKTSIVMCTAMSQKDMVMEAIKAGAKDFIIKPFQPDRVIESVQKIVGWAPGR